MFVFDGMISILIFGKKIEILKNHFAFDFMHVLNVHLHILKIHLFYAMIVFNKASIDANGIFANPVPFPQIFCWDQIFKTLVFTFTFNGAQKQ